MADEQTVLLEFEKDILYNQNLEVEVCAMTNFFLCILQYLLIMIVLVAIGVGGAIIGIALRKKKDAKAALETKAEE